jgi:hypothetical protein
MELQITVELKNVYGNEKIYPVCENAHTFAKIAGKKTLDKTDLRHIKQLGFVVNLKQKSLVI